jgi:DNA-directed RNA polymerase subunit omega
MIKSKVYLNSDLNFKKENNTMARITIEDCLKQVNNRFSLIHMASKRVRQLRKGAESRLVTKNRDIVTALREIAAGHVQKVESNDQDSITLHQVDILPEELERESDDEILKDENSGESEPEGN